MEEEDNANEYKTQHVFKKTETQDPTSTHVLQGIYNSLQMFT